MERVQICLFIQTLQVHRQEVEGDEVLEAKKVEEFKEGEEVLEAKKVEEFKEDLELREVNEHV